MQTDTFKIILNIYFYPQGSVTHWYDYNHSNQQEKFHQHLDQTIQCGSKQGYRYDHFSLVDISFTDLVFTWNQGNF